jgi:hypothetical protein
MGGDGMSANLNSINTVTHFIWAEHNIERDVLLHWAFPNWSDLHPKYQVEKLAVLKRDGLAGLWMALDTYRRSKLLTKINEHYSVGDDMEVELG